MMILKVDPLEPEMAAVRAGADAIRAGELVIFPTETVYGLAADALDEAAVRKVIAAKGREDRQPLPVQVADVDDLRRVAEFVPENARFLVDRYWPGPLTLVLPRSADIPDVVTAGRKTIGVRIPNHPVALALLRELRSPIIATSANLSGDEPALTAEEAVCAVGHAVSVVLDAGKSDLQVASTVVDVSTVPPKLLRQGTINAAEIRDILGELEESAG